MSSITKYIKGTAEYNRRLNPYQPMHKSYIFIDKDPDLLSLLALIEQDNDQPPKLAQRAGLSTSTVKKLILGRTKRAQHLTYVKLLTAMNYQFTIIRKHHQ